MVRQPGGELGAGYDFRRRPAHPPRSQGGARIGTAYRLCLYAHSGRQAGAAMESAGWLCRYSGDVARPVTAFHFGEMKKAQPRVVLFCFTPTLAPEGRRVSPLLP